MGARPGRRIDHDYTGAPQAGQPSTGHARRLPSRSTSQSMPAPAGPAKSSAEAAKRRCSVQAPGLALGEPTGSDEGELADLSGSRQAARCQRWMSSSEGSY